MFDYRLIASVVLGLIGCLASGCSGDYWAGETSRKPGITLQGPGLLSAPKLHVTSDIRAKLDRMKWKAGEWELEGAEFGQDASTVTTAEIPKLYAMAEIQRTQKEYAVAFFEGLAANLDVVGRHLAPVLQIFAAAKVQKTTSGLTMEFPGGFKVGKETITEPAQLQELFAGLSQQLQAAQAQAAAGKTALSVPSEPERMAEAIEPKPVEVQP